MSEQAVRLVPEGLSIAGKTVPLLAGSVHYWRLARADWRACLQAVKALGFRLVDIYVPWAVHEIAPGRFDFGEGDPRLDVGRFLEMIGEAGLYAIVRPGPHINAELTYFGIPERVIWDRDCQARSARGNPVMLPMVPVAFPVPSYASEKFHAEARVFFEACGPVIAPHIAPKGPVVMVQVDNEGAMYFRDGAYDQDYHPDAVALYRAFLREKYGSLESLTASYGADAAPFDDIEPPQRFDATAAEGLARHLDWMEFHEHLLAHSMKKMRAAMAEVGIRGVPTSHNLPFGQETTALNPARISQAVDLVGIDYYHRATPLDRAVIARRTTEIAARCEGRKEPPFAAEMGAGFPPFFPPLDEADSEFTLLCALAYGLRGFNIYMAVSRDRWIGGPIDPKGKLRPSARFYERLCQALERVGFAGLRRAAPVRLLTPRSLRRLTRAMHAFGPVTGAFFAVLGAGARERCLEDDLGLGGPIAVEGDVFVRAFEQALDARGVPFAHVGGEDADVALEGAKWVVAVTTGGMKPALFHQLRAAAGAGARVTIGPRVPTRDGAMRPLSSPFDTAGLELLEVDPLSGLAPAEADRAVARAIDELSLPTYACDPDGVYACVHHDADARPKVVFVLNPGQADVVARLAVPGVRGARDLLDEGRVACEHGTLELRLPPRTVRMLEVTSSLAMADKREPLISFRDVHKAFGPKRVYTGLNLDVYEHETLVILGGSGVGKSVMLKMLIGLLVPDKGTILFKGKNVVGMNERELGEVRRKVAMIFQASALFDSISVGDNVAYALHEHHHREMSKAEIAKRVAWALELVGLPGIEGMKPGDLSGGMKRRVGLARAIALQPEVLLWDEPTTGLDPINTTRINHLMTGMQRALHVTSLVVTHDMSSAFSVADRIAMVFKGRVILQAPKEEFRHSNDPRVHDFINGLAPEGESLESLLEG